MEEEDRKTIKRQDDNKNVEENDLSVATKKHEKQKTQDETKKDTTDLHDVIISVESRKGGVGKTTAALSAAKVLAEAGYAVLYLDCDVTGTSLSKCAESPLWNKSIHLLEEKPNPSPIIIKKPVNIFKSFNRFFKDNTLDFEDRIKEEIPISIMNKKFLAISSVVLDFSKDGYPYFDSLDLNNLITYQTEECCYNELITTDYIHSKVFIEFLKRSISVFSNEVNKLSTKRPVAVILDNSPGYIGISPMIKDWLLSLGPKHGKFIYVSNPDFPSIESTINSLASLILSANEKVYATQVLLKDIFGNSSKLDEVLNWEEVSFHKKIVKDEIMKYIDLLDIEEPLKSFPEYDYYLETLQNKNQTCVDMNDFCNKIHLPENQRDVFVDKYNFVCVIANKTIDWNENPFSHYGQGSFKNTLFRSIKYDSTLARGFDSVDNATIESKKKYLTNEGNNRFFTLHFIHDFLPSNKHALKFTDTFIRAFPMSTFEGYEVDHFSYDTDRKNELFTDTSFNKPLEYKKINKLYSILGILLNETGGTKFPSVLDEIRYFIIENKLNIKKLVLVYFYIIIVLNSQDKDITSDDILSYSMHFLDDLKNTPLDCDDMDVWVDMKRKLKYLSSTILKHSYTIASINEIHSILFDYWKIGTING